ncbi:hypothetical protein BVAVS116_E0037 (plasmid) [Borreliella valaisiana VS116]|uniref:Uncharacterized protein n=1 Tax=Borreliella valaisiana VS116 TaxID=445987 RepID=C0R8R8_BORVA|nr:hypothetical protein BVAVS116_E0037 [Borreliella valaisiana VS116]
MIPYFKPYYYDYLFRTNDSFYAIKTPQKLYALTALHYLTLFRGFLFFS